MKKLLLIIPFLLGFSFPLKAELDNADLDKSKVQKNSNEIYSGWCGKFDYTFSGPKEEEIKCNVQFKGERLIVNNGKGIKNNQISSIKIENRCKAVFIFGSCGRRNKEDKRYIISYISSKGSLKTAMISFRNNQENERFREDIEIWMGKSFGGVGPTINK